ncbi:HlyD family secretion protein [Burkholderia sp. Bp9126]|nr:HlyD family secretion protein [Burkholderia sp. Bp9126]
MSLKPLTRSLLTLATVGLAIALVAALWRAYVLAPWTRDGRVSAHVVRIAPEVSGTVIDVAVIDNQRVSKGDVLYRIDPQRFALAVEQAEAQVASSAETVRQKQDEARRRTGLDELVPKEDIQRSGRAVSIAQADYRKALAALDVAKLDLARATLRAPVDGYVTQLRLRHGDYAVAGRPDISVLDAHSFWITGYFEETKLRRIASGAPAQIKLMGFDPLLSGHVTSIGRGIADENGALDETGLPTVNPNFTWVRLAQRIPVRIELDHVPAGVLLAAGMTCSVEIGEPGRGTTPRGRLASWLHAWM